MVRWYVSCWVTLVIYSKTITCTYLLVEFTLFTSNHLYRKNEHTLHACFRMHVLLLLDCNSVVPCHHKNCLSFLHVSHTLLNTRISSFYQTNWDLFWFHVAMISCWLLELHQGSPLACYSEHFHFHHQNETLSFMHACVRQHSSSSKWENVEESWRFIWY